jgi:hypothetical protein
MMEIIVNLLIALVELVPLLCFGCIAMAVMIASVLYMCLVSFLKFITYPLLNKRCKLCGLRCESASEV